MVVNRADVDEILQEVNLYLWEHQKEFELGTDFFAWASRVSYFHVLSYRKKTGRDRLVFGETLLEQLATDQTGISNRSESLARGLEECMARLEPRDRDLLVGRYTSRRSIAEIAVELGKTERAIYKSLGKLRQRLLACVRIKLHAEGVI
jgi:RNA polymerase sigma-70 factor (ECF subfamily)